MGQLLRTIRNWLASPGRLAALKLRARRGLAVTRPLQVEGSRLVFTAESFLELSRSQEIAEGWTAHWVRNLPRGSVLWDVGANIGVFSLLAAENPNVEAVVAIEPAYFNYAAILRNAILNKLTGKVVALPIGLGEETGERQFKLQNLKPGGSMHAFGDIYAFRDRSVDPAATYGCLCYRLDDLVAMPGLRFPTHIKIDIDGNEGSVLRGGDKTFADPRLHGLQIEVMDSDPALPRRQEVVAFLAQRGWKLGDTILHKSDDPIIADLQFTRA